MFFPCPLRSHVDSGGSLGYFILILKQDEKKDLLNR